MARARNIKPGFFRDAALVELPVETRLLFPGLWTLADRAGRLEDKPKQIKMEIYPADNFDVEVMLCQLSDVGLIVRYEIDGKRYIQVKNFEKHQNPHRDEKASTIPAPCEHGASTVQEECKHGGNRADSLIPDSLNLSPESKHAPAKPAQFDSRNALEELGVEQSVADDWLRLRKQKRAPVTQTALDGIRSEAAKAGLLMNEALKTCCARGWQGFEAAWLTANGARASPKTPTRDEARREVMRVLTGKGGGENGRERDITGEAVRVA